MPSKYAQIKSSIDRYSFHALLRQVCSTCTDTSIRGHMHAEFCCS
jgi:hypothetical protein